MTDKPGATEKAEVINSNFHKQESVTDNQEKLTPEKEAWLEIENSVAETDPRRSIKEIANQVDSSKVKVVNRRKEKKDQVLTESQMNELVEMRQVVFRSMVSKEEVTVNGIVQEQIENESRSIRKECEDLGVIVEPAKVYFVPKAKRNSVLDSRNRIYGIQASVNDYITGATYVEGTVVVFVDDDDTDLRLIGKAVHELNHGVRGKTTIIHDDKFTTMKAGSTVERSGVSKGLFFEEAKAIRAEKNYINTTGKDVLPNDYSSYKEYEQKLSDQFHPYTSINAAYEAMVGRIPQLDTLIRKASVTGDWQNLGNLIDEAYEPGTFKVLMGFSQKDVGNVVKMAVVETFAKQGFGLQALTTVISDLDTKMK